MSRFKWPLYIQIKIFGIKVRKQQQFQPGFVTRLLELGNFRRRTGWRGGIHIKLFVLLHFFICHSSPRLGVSYCVPLPTLSTALLKSFVSSKVFIVSMASTLSNFLSTSKFLIPDSLRRAISNFYHGVLRLLFSYFSYRWRQWTTP